MDRRNSLKKTALGLAAIAATQLRENCLFLILVDSICLFPNTVITRCTGEVDNFLTALWYLDANACLFYTFLRVNKTIKQKTRLPPPGVSS